MASGLDIMRSLYPTGAVGGGAFEIRGESRDLARRFVCQIVRDIELFFRHVETVEGNVEYGPNLAEGDLELRS